MSKIATLLLSGANNHDWQRSTPFLRELLEESGKFEVQVTNDISTALEDSGSLAAQSLIVDDYNGPDPSEKAKSALETSVGGGTGFVVVHAANNSFKGWNGFERMAGLLFREGSGHGEFHEFQVTIKNRDHPITRGIEDFRQWDELYHGLLNIHDVPHDLLATAHSDPAKGGSGRDEPMMIALQYGSGRVFHQILGHVWPEPPWEGYKGCSMIALENPGFQSTFLRGCEWAATGGVTSA